MRDLSRLGPPSQLGSNHPSIADISATQHPFRARLRVAESTRYALTHGSAENFPSRSFWQPIFDLDRPSALGSNLSSIADISATEHPFRTRLRVPKSNYCGLTHGSAENFPSRSFGESIFDLTMPNHWRTVQVENRISKRSRRETFGTAVS